MPTELNCHSDWPVLGNIYPHMCIHASVLGLGGCPWGNLGLVVRNLSKDKVNNSDANGKVFLPRIATWQWSKEKQNCCKNISDHLLNWVVVSKLYIYYSKGNLMHCPSEVECANAIKIRDKYLTSSLSNESIRNWPPTTWNYVGSTIPRLTYLWTYINCVSTATQIGSSKSWGQSSPS